MQTPLLLEPAHFLQTNNTLQSKSADYSPPVDASADYSLSLRTGDDPLRPALEHYIATRYERRHKASIEHFMPHLLALDDGQKTGAALGLTSARQQALFLECYLNKPVEQAISQALNTPVDRSKIIEIGNLAASQRAASQLLFTLLSALLDQSAYRWIVFTATPCVQALVENRGFSLHTIGQAKAERLNSHADWGSYYETQPQVMVGCIDDAMRKALSPAMHRELGPYQRVIGAIAAAL